MKTMRDRWPQDEEEDIPFGEQWDAEREADKEAPMEEGGPMAVASAIPGWIAMVLGGGFAWVTEDVAGQLACELQAARRELRGTPFRKQPKAKP